MTKELLVIENLCKSFDRPILKNLSLKVHEGEYVSVTGPSGCGKSTLMNILGLMEPYDSGSYLYRDKAIVTEADRCRVRSGEIGFIFQAYHLLPTLTVEENIVLPSMYSKKTPRPLEPLMEELGIMSLRSKFPSQLSGGEKQRVAIARAIRMSPDLLLADEPTGNLDRKNRDIVLELLEKEHKKGSAILLITHDPEAALLAETRYRLEGGQLHEQS